MMFTSLALGVTLALMPSLIYAPDVQGYEFITRLDQKTGSVVMEFDERHPQTDWGPPAVDGRDLYSHLRHMGELDREHIVTVLANQDGRLIGWKVPHVGQLASVEASVRQMVRDALLGSASYLSLLHNHPSGNPNPSEADRELTEAVATLAGRWGIVTPDHVVVGSERNDVPYHSFRAAGEMPAVQVLDAPTLDLSVPRHRLVRAPAVGAYEFVTKYAGHPPSLVMVRDDAYASAGRSGPPMAPRAVASMFRQMGELDAECLGAVIGNVRGEIVGWEAFCVGDVAAAEPRRIEAVLRQMVKDSLLANAASISILHNYPDGHSHPTDVDEDLLKGCGALAADWEMHLADVMVLGRGQRGYFSFAESGAIKPPETE